MRTISIARDYTKLPGPRFKTEGPNSGEEFREMLLRPAFEAAQKAGEKLTVELDGVRFGYPTSFLEEAFGGLARDVGVDPIRSVLILASEEEPALIEEIYRYIRDAHLTSAERAEGLS